MTITDTDDERILACLFINFEDYKKFCFQINRPDFIHSKTDVKITFDELKKSMMIKDKMESFYE